VPKGLLNLMRFCYDSALKREGKGEEKFRIGAALKKKLSSISSWASNGDPREPGGGKKVTKIGGQIQ